MPSSPRNRGLLLLGAMFLATGCADSLDHRDNISVAAGNAAAANTAIHTYNTWPANVGNTTVGPKR